MEGHSGKWWCCQSSFDKNEQKKGANQDLNPRCSTFPPCLEEIEKKIKRDGHEITYIVMLGC